SLVLTEFPLHVSLWELSAYALPLLSMALLIRIYSQRWLREPHEGGLHLAGGFLRVSTWWIYTLGFVYALLRVRVPYVPTPKEDHKGNEWKLALPNLVAVVLMVWASKFGRVQALSPYTNMMVALCLLNAGILLAATFMGQYKMVQNFVYDMTAQPYRPLWLGAQRLLHTAGEAFIPRLRCKAGTVAVMILIVTVGAKVYFLPAFNTLPKWLTQGDYTLRIGQLMPLESKEYIKAGFLNGTKAKDEDAAYQIAAFDLPANTPFALPQSLLQGPKSSQLVPLISWTINADSVRSINYARHIVQQLSDLSPGVMLRPLLPPSNAQAHRLAWRELVTNFRRAGIRNAVWVWTPPQVDSVAYYVPNKKFFNWIGTPFNAVKSQSYNSIRAQVAGDYDLHPKPVVLLYTDQTKHSNEVVAKSLARAYPEIDAVIFAPEAGEGAIKQLEKSF
ncbi:hypothetical protein ACW9KT_16830, partial [Hymenobacter sp. HD11105]